MYRSSNPSSFHYEGADLEEYVTPTSRILPPPPQQSLCVQSSEYIHPMTKRDDDFNEELQQAMKHQSAELYHMRYQIDKILKKQKKERCALLKYIYSLQHREYDEPSPKPYILYAACAVIVLLIVLIIVVIISMTRRKNTDFQTLVALAQLLHKYR